jgi:hypothetical protein
MFHRNYTSPIPLSARDVQPPAQGSTKKADCIDGDYPGALDKMLSMSVSSLLWENQDLQLPAYIWAPTIAVPVSQGLA